MAFLRRGTEEAMPGRSMSGKNFIKKGTTPVTDTLSTKKTVIRRRKHKGVQQRNMATVKGKVVKSAVEEYRKQHRGNNLKRNLKYMQDVKFAADSAVTKQVLDQNRGRKSIDRKSEKAKGKAVASVFTDTDFKRFEREYFGGGSVKK